MNELNRVTAKESISTLFLIHVVFTIDCRSQTHGVVHENYDSRPLKLYLKQQGGLTWKLQNMKWFN